MGSLRGDNFRISNGESYEGCGVCVVLELSLVGERCRGIGIVDRCEFSG